jgi:hypothetical protein
LRAMQKELKYSPLPRLTALGAAVLALPIGVALGRLSGRRHDRLD